MCGISGIVAARPLTREDVASVRAMSGMLFHRGPDGTGEYVGNHVALASRRLAVIGIENGAQPIYSADGSLVLIANGEIYNHRDLRLTLERKGHKFRTESDCEAILHCYAEFNLDFVDHLRGMFAFAIWDNRRKRLVLGRDPMGEKPLLLFERDGKLIFASEMKALLASGFVPFDLDPAAIDLYFHYQYVPEPKTAIRGVRKLDAAHLLVVDVEPWRQTDRSYWRMEDAGPLNSDPIATIRESLTEVSTLVTRADVPVGIALSGGLDSSAIAALASRDLGGNLQAFSVGYATAPAGIDERNDARDFARHLGIPFKAIEVRTEDVVEFFPELNFWRDDPIADYAGHGYHAVMKAAAESGVRVMMQGQGGDELFWGYPVLRQAALETHRKSRLNRLAPRSLLPYFRPIDPLDVGAQNKVSASQFRGSFSRLWKDLRAPSDQMVFYDLAPDYAAAAEMGRHIYTAGFHQLMRESKPSDVFTVSRPWHSVDIAMTRLVSQTYLRSNGVVQGDRLAMASSVELRLPFLDRKFVETVVGLRKASTDLMLPPKTWLKQAVSHVLPDWVLSRPKRGFEPPVQAWHDQIFQRYGASLNGGYLAQSRVLSETSLKDFSGGEAKVGLSCPMSFKALVLEQWCRSMRDRLPSRAA